MYRFLIYISYPYSLPIGWPLEQEIKSRGDQVCWFSDVQETKKHFKKGETLLEDVQAVLDYNPHVVLTATDQVADFFPGIKVQIFHGFSANKRPEMNDHFKIRGFFDLYTTQGPSTTSIFQEQAKKYGFFEVVETGWSKVDPLFPIEPKTGAEKPTILISSTFTTRLSLAQNQEVFSEIKRLASTGKYHFLCVLHPKLPPQIKEKFAALNSAHFEYHDTTDLIPLFKKSDIMFSDTTSAIIEFILQGKPVVTFNNRKPGPELINVTEVAAIQPALDRALSRPQETLNEIQKYIVQTHPYTDGRSSKRVIDACVSFLNKDKSHLKKKPWNLLRKWKIRKNLKYFTLRSYCRPLTVKL